MGICPIKLSGSSFSEKFKYDSVDCKYYPRPVPNNPDPRHYTILKYAEYKRYLLVSILYPDCKNYEGKKLLLFKDVTIKQLKKQRLIDPHFSDNKDFYSPIARFEPTENGWNMALTLIKSLVEKGEFGT